MLALLRSPHQGAIAQGLVLALLSTIALLLRLQLDMDGVRDVDALNFGLSAWNFNPMEQRPHPPGYLGYVLYLKGLHWIAPGLSVPALAKWGSRILGVLCVPAAWWTVRVLLRGGPQAEDGSFPAVRPLAAATLVLTQPLLWYYGADGQSHASEALATLLLFGSAVLCRRSGRGRDLVLLALAVGLAGSLRPTIPLLCSPLLVWVAWGQPVGRWVRAVLSGLVGTLAWYVPTAWAAGGHALYTRASGALIESVFLQHFSVFGSGSDPTLLMVNANIVFWGLGLSLLLLPGWMGSLTAEDVAWRRAAAAIFLLSAAFYGLVYAAESGYFTGLAALSVLAPATWPRSAAAARRGVSLTVAGALLGACFVLFGPPETPILGAAAGARVVQPTFRNLWRWEAITASYQRSSCDPAEEGHTVLVTDSNISELQRGLALDCDVSVVRVVTPSELHPTADEVLIYQGVRLIAIPTGVPFEPGPPVTYRFNKPIRRVRVSPAAGLGMTSMLEDQQLCPRLPFSSQAEPPGVSSTPTWDVSCLPQLSLGSHTLVF